MKPELEPLDADVLALLSAEKPVADLPAPAKDALFAAIEAKINLPPGPGTDGGAGTAGPAGPAASGASGGLLGGGLSGVRALAALATTFVIGVGTGGVMDRNLGDSPPVRTAPSTIAPPALSAIQAVPVPPTAEPPALAFSALPTFTSPAAAKLDPPTPVPSARGLAAERGLLDVARSALARGEAGAALTATERHSREYPSGVLVEEREAIAIKALVALGRKDEAQTRAKAFEQRFPNGLMLRAVRGAVGAP
jgi:hypothetical protein